MPANWLKNSMSTGFIQITFGSAHETRTASQLIFNCRLCPVRCHHNDLKLSANYEPDIRKSFPFKNNMIELKHWNKIKVLQRL